MKDNSRSFETFRGADSVLLRALKPNWNLSMMLLLSKLERSYMKTIFPSSLDGYGSLEMGWKLFSSDL